jgi:hypothetical protein
MAKLILCFDSFQAVNKRFYKYTYEGNKLYIKQGNKKYTHRVSFITKNITYSGPQIEPLYRFVSALCWKYKQPVYVGGLAGSGNNNFDYTEPAKFHRMRGFSIPQNLFEPQSENQKIVLGLYREAKSSESPFYSFLAYYKILESHFRKKDAIKNWINSSTSLIKENKDKLKEICQTKPNINLGKRVIDFRNGIAHAFGGRQVISVDGYPKIRELNMIIFILGELCENLTIDKFKFPKD